VALTVSALAQVMDIPPGWVTMAMPGDPSAYARCLYARLRDADALGLEQIRIEKPLINDAWMAIHDRLSRAAVPPSASQSDSQREGEHP
jgi:hypothetical protein